MHAATVPSITALSSSTAPSSNNDLGMVNPSMPELHAEQAKTLLKDSLAYEQEVTLAPPRTRMTAPNLKVQIPLKKKAAIVEIPNPVTGKPITAEYQAPESNKNQIAEDFWKKCHKAQVRASHPSFSNKYTVLVELFDKDAQSLGTIETGTHDNPGNYCFFCLDYFPENYKVNKDLKVSCITPYCSFCPKNVYQAAETKGKWQKLGQVKSVFCSNKMNIYDQQGKLAYGLKNGNTLLRKFRFLVEVPFLMLCIPYKLVSYCCVDSCWKGKSNEIKLYDYSTKKEVVVGVTTNQVERKNEWQEVVRDGQKISQYKGEEIFMCKQFEVTMPEEASEDLKKLIVGALIADIPSTIDRCAC